MAKKLQLKRSDVIYENRTSALNELNTYVQSNIDELLDGEPLVGRYYDNGVCKAILGIVYKKANISGVYYFDTEGSQQGQLVPADESISIENDQISVNLKSGEDNVLKLDENGLFVSLDELIDRIPQTDLSGVESAITATQRVAFGEPISSDMVDAQAFYADDANLSGTTSLVEADKVLSERVDENSLTIAAAFNNLNDRLVELSANTPTVEEFESIASDIEAISGVVDDNSLTIAAAFNNLNDRLATLSDDVDSLSENTVTTEEFESLANDVEALSGAVEDSSLVTSAALNYLNDNLTDLSGSVETLASDVSDLAEDLAELSENTPTVEQFESLANDVNAISGVVDDNSLTIAAAFNALNDRITELSADTASDTRVEELEESVSNIEGTLETVGEDVDNLESGLTDVQDSIDALESGFTQITQVIVDNELVISSSLNDLNSRIIELSGSSVTNITSESLVITQDGNTINIELPEIEVSGGDY